MVIGGLAMSRESFRAACLRTARATKKALQREHNPEVRYILQTRYNSAVAALQQRQS